MNHIRDFRRLALTLFIALSCVPSLHSIEFTNFVEVGSIVGGLGLGAPKSTSDIIFATRTGSALTSPGGVAYAKAGSDSSSPRIFPQFGYGFALNQKFIWDFSIIANKTNVLNDYYAGSDGSFFRDHYESHSYTFKSAVGYRFYRDQIFKIGYGFDRVNAPTDFILAGTRQAYGRGYMDQMSAGPYAGFELNGPLGKSGKLFVFADLYYFFSRGDLHFNSGAGGPTYVSFYRGTASVEAHSAYGYGGIKYLFYKNYGIKVGFFEQLTMSKVLGVEGYNFDNGHASPMIRTNKSNNWNTFRGIYVAFTTKI